MKPTQEQFNNWRAEKLSCTREHMETMIGGPCLDISGNVVGTVMGVDDINWYWAPATGLNAYLVYTADVNEDYGCSATIVYAETEEKAREAFITSFDFSFYLSEKRKNNAFDPINPVFKVMLVDKKKTEPEVITLCSYFE